MKENNHDELLLVKSDKVKKIKYYGIDSKTHKHQIIAGKGRCSECGCVSFRGTGSTCERDTCGHDYASHSWRD